ncbi:DUF4157 domain-containing protein [Massilia sp. CCM 8695]|uniref:DUF4157 domain-containing protein n=2 Tax=Massilia frigida TaxID=2609281 RepID=A0ABX0NEU1_9BURK|nr:DUF4157 domain-containing protein [Massilia frigida]
MVNMAAMMNAAPAANSRAAQAMQLRMMATDANGKQHALRQVADMIHDSARQQTAQRFSDAMIRGPATVAQGVADEQALQPASASPSQPAHDRIATTGKSGLPDQLKSGIEGLSGISMEGVKVHYNCARPAQLHAQAYAQGKDIHLGPGQEQHLPHEAWHVVQQAQGRVRATMQMKDGVAVNDDIALEQEADRMGAKAATFGSSAPATSDQHSGAPGAAAARVQPVQQKRFQEQSAVVQRMVGFEFETGWFVDFQAPGDNGEIVAPAPFAKKDVVRHANNDGFRMEADEAEQGLSELEFVIRPPVAESQAGRQALVHVMTAMGAITTALLERAGGGRFSLDQITHDAADTSTLVTPRDAAMQAGPQATTALMLEQIPRMINRDVAAAPLNAAPNAHAAADGGAAAFRGLATLIGQYIDNGVTPGGAITYPKMIAEPLLARTSFVGLFNLLDNQRRALYIADPGQWVTDIFQVAGLPIELADRDLLDRGVVAEHDTDAHRQLRTDILVLELNPPAELAQFDARIKTVTDAMPAAPSGRLAAALARLRKQRTLKDLAQTQMDLLREKAVVQAPYDAQREGLLAQKSALETRAGFTVRQWLAGILQQVDSVAGLADAESMGEFGARTEDAGPAQDVPSGIFEWRGDQRRKIPPAQWMQYALDFMDRILAMHGHGHAPEPPGPG